MAKVAVMKSTEEAKAVESTVAAGSAADDSPAQADLRGELRRSGLKLCYQSRRDGNSELYVMDADGSNPVNITNTPDVDEVYPHVLKGGNMEIVQLQRGHLADVVPLWNDAVEAQGEGYQDYILSHQRLVSIMEDKNFLPSGALVALSSGRLVGFALGYVQRVDFRREGDLDAKPGRLAGLAIRPDRWRQEVGRALLEAVEAALREEGRWAASFQTYGMPISLVHGIYVDSGPYRFLMSCGYRPLEHELRLRNELPRFSLSKDIGRRRRRLASEGFTFRWYEPADRDDLLQFMARYFSSGWHTSIQRATDREPHSKILLAVGPDRIVGFMGPFYVGEPGQRGGFSSPGVHPDFRRRGIGTVLFHMGLDYLKRAGAGYTEYGTGVTNPARFMYLRSGARLTAVYCSNFHKEL